MKKLYFTLSILTIGLTLGCFTWAANNGKKTYINSKTPYKIVSMQAKLFYTDKGTFSENIIDNSKYDCLYNTIIGEGNAGGCADNLLVIVKVAGKPGEYQDYDVKLIATSNKHVLLIKKSHLIMNDNGEGYVSFWIYDCTMKPLHLRAELIGQKTTSSIYHFINFMSGD
jgi:hypothetical protein